MKRQFKDSNGKWKEQINMNINWAQWAATVVAVIIVIATGIVSNSYFQADTNRHFINIDTRLDRFEQNINERFDQVSIRFDKVDNEITAIEDRLRSVEERLARVEVQVDNNADAIQELKRDVSELNMKAHMHVAPQTTAPASP